MKQLDIQQALDDFEKTIYGKIMSERERQDTKWGGAKHDDEHSCEDWAVYLMQYSDRLLHVNEYVDRTRAKAILIKIAALAVAAHESLDRRFKDGN